jgi:uncharacterized circularly permuted ATP-grasp superfamily protein/uncharacterized alpha-E superfamily protein
MTLSPNLTYTNTRLNLWADYRPPASRYDEMADATGFRPHWQAFVQALGQLGLGELQRRWREARDLIRENGITYNVYADPRGNERPWALDPLPLLVGPAEWAGIEAGLNQRARVLERILADLYGPQRLLREGLLPPALVFANPGFLLPCHGKPMPRPLVLYSADLGRSPCGQMTVLGDRAQAPSGTGYTLENRLVLSRVLPELFRDFQVHRLARFFRTLRDTLHALAPHNRDQPRTVLLTPGPYNETYFEHAYLARYLGYTLVEGGDLTVRDNRVYLKQLGGLQPVDVILRRLDDTFSDPLELRGDSFLGVPGLVQAARAGNVAVANPLGSGLVETPALSVYLPQLCRHLLGEELLIPSVQAWWCADPIARQHVLANLHRLVIKPTFPMFGREPIFGELLSAVQKQELADRIRARPGDYVAQEQLFLSTCPVLVSDRPEPRHMVLRAALTADGLTQGSYMVMPGGLTRVSGSSESLVVSLQKGGGSKDTWVLSPEPVAYFSLLRDPTQPIELSRGGNDLSSRVADNLFWLGRYAERSEGLVRLLRGILVRLTEKFGVTDTPELPGLMRALTQDILPHRAGNGARAATRELEVRARIFDERIGGSLRSALQLLRQVAAKVRDRISIDTWRILSAVGPEHLAEGTGLPLGDLLSLLDEMVTSLAAFGGTVAESMTRGHGWRFLDMGRRLERAVNTVALLRPTLIARSNAEGPLLEALLEVAECSMTYRRRYLAGVQAAPVIDLLLADESNPRSLAFQLVVLSDHVDQVPSDWPGGMRTAEQRIALRALTTLRLADAQELGKAGEDGVRRQLDRLLADLHTDLPTLGDSITRSYFTHVPPSRQLTRDQMPNE